MDLFHPTKVLACTCRSFNNKHFCHLLLDNMFQVVLYLSRLLVNEQSPVHRGAYPIATRKTLFTISKTQKTKFFNSSEGFLNAQDSQEESERATKHLRTEPRTSWPRKLPHPHPAARRLDPLSLSVALIDLSERIRRGKQSRKHDCAFRK